MDVLAGDGVDIEEAVNERITEEIGDIVAVERDAVALGEAEVPVGDEGEEVVGDTVGFVVVGDLVGVALKQRGPRDTPTKAPLRGGKPVASS